MPLIHIHMLTSNERIKDLCTLFWATKPDQKFTHTVSELAARFGVKSPEVSKLVAEGCQAYSEGNICAQCGQPFVYSSRADYQQKLKFVNANRVCAPCAAKEAEAREILRLADLDLKRQAIRNYYARASRPPLNIDELSFENAVYLLSFIRATASEDLLTYGPLEAIKEPLSPSLNFSYEMLKQLYGQHYITVHPTSSVDAFGFEDGEPSTLYLNHVLWSLNFGSDITAAQKYVVELERILRTGEWPEHWYSERLPLWKKIALQECLEYLDVVLNEHNLNLTPGEKTLLVFRNVLEEYSVGQAYNMIWRAGKDAAAFYMRGGVSKAHASNTVVGAIQRNAERAKAEGWETKAYRRDRRCPESITSQVLFNTALKIGEDGFNLPPVDSSLKE